MIAESACCSGDQDNALVPSNRRMRGFDRDLIRGGHYGQRVNRT